MQIAISDAQAQLTDLVSRAEAGDEIVLTRQGRTAVRLDPGHGLARPRRPSVISLGDPGRRLREGFGRRPRGAQPGPPLRRGRSSGVIVVDTSAFMAVVLGEVEREAQ